MTPTGHSQVSLPISAPMPVSEKRESVVGQATSQAKLNGRVYTPLGVAQQMLERIRWPTSGPGPSLLDPSCGEGVFLDAALRKLASSDLPIQEAISIIESQMEGWDINAEALATCAERLRAVSTDLGFQGRIPHLVHRDALADRGEQFDFVVGNPPYLEAKRMPDSLKRHVKACCPVAAKGAFDLYSAFVERGLKILVDQGELCFIIPNRILVVSYASGLRSLLLTTSHIRVFDLSTARVFEDAAVYPIVLVARKGTRRGYRVEAWNDDGNSIELPVEAIESRTAGMLPLLPETSGGRALLRRVLTAPEFKPLKAFASTRWCVSFHRAGLRDKFTFDGPPKKPTGTPMRFLGGGRFMGNREVQPFGISWGGWWIDFDESRARAERNQLPPLEIFKAPKVVVCQNARRCRVALDRTGYVLKDTFLSVRCRSNEHERAGLPEWITLVLNSRLFHYLYEHLYGGTRKGGGFLHFLPRYLDPFPFAEPPDDVDVRALHDAVEKGKTPLSEVDTIVERAWGITSVELKVLNVYEFPQH